MANIIITGANGFLGTSLLQQFLSRGDRVTALVRNCESIEKKIAGHPNLKIKEIDRKDYAKISEHIETIPDIAIHLAWAGTRMPHRQNREIQEENCKHSLDFMSAVYRMGTKVFVGAGSQEEYGTATGISEEEVPCPLSEYGIAKLKTYEEGKKQADKLGVRFIWPRIFSVYGPGDNPHTVVMSSLKKMLNNWDVSLTSCTQLWDFLFIDDATAALMVLLDKGAEGVYNVASGKATIMSSFISKMKELTMSRSNLLFGTKDVGAPAKDLCPSIKKIASDTGWYPNISFDEGILKTINWVKQEGLL